MYEVSYIHTKKKLLPVTLRKLSGKCAKTGIWETDVNDDIQAGLESESQIETSVLYFSFKCLK